MSAEHYAAGEHLWELLRRPRYDVENWRKGKANFDDFWAGFAREEEFSKVTHMTNLPIAPDQMMYVAYEQALLLSVDTPEFGDVVGRIRVLFGISVGEHKELVKLLIPQDGFVGLNPLDIRHRCALLMNPFLWQSGDDDFIQRQLWVIEQSVIAKVQSRASAVSAKSDEIPMIEDDVFTRPCLCLTRQIRKRIGLQVPAIPSSADDDFERSSAGARFCPSDPLSVGYGAWEFNLRDGHVIFLVASLLRILNHLAGQKQWFASDEMNHYFCAPLWSCITDETAEDFLHEDHQMFVGLLLQQFHLPFETMSLFAASRVFHQIMLGLQDGDFAVIPEKALFTVERLLTDFDAFFPSPADIARSKKWKDPPENPRLFLVRRIITAEFRDQLVYVLQDYRQYVQLKGLLPIIAAWKHVYEYVDPSFMRQKDEDFNPTLLRWCVLSSAQRHTSRLLPEYYRAYKFANRKEPTEDDLEKEATGIYEYMTQLAKSLENMTGELAIEAEYFASVWTLDKSVADWAKMTEKGHMRIIVRGMRDSISSHFRIIALAPIKGGPWRDVEEIPPGLGAVATEAVAFETVAENYDLDIAEREKFFGTLQPKIDVALNARLENFDRDLLRKTFSKTTIWEPVNPEQNLLHSQGVTDLWHFIFTAQEMLSALGIPLVLFSRVFLEFLLRMTNRFRYLCQRDFPSFSDYEMPRNAAEICERLTPDSTLLVPKSVEAPKKKVMERLAEKLAGKGVMMQPKWMTAKPLRHLTARPDKSHTVNELLVRMRSVTFFIFQMQALSARFKPSEDTVGLPERTSSSRSFASCRSREIHAERVWQQWNDYIAQAEVILVDLGKSLAWYFSTVVVYVECDYLFESVYCASSAQRTAKTLDGQLISSDVSSLTLDDVLKKELPVLNQLLQLMQPPSGHELEAFGQFFEAGGFAPKVAQVLVKNFTEAWLVVVVSRMLKEAPPSVQLVMSDADSLQTFADELTRSNYILPDGVLAIQAICAQKWTTHQFYYWAEEMATHNAHKAPSPKKKKILETPQEPASAGAGKEPAQPQSAVPSQSEQSPSSEPASGAEASFAPKARVTGRKKKKRQSARYHVNKLGGESAAPPKKKSPNRKKIAS